MCVVDVVVVYVCYYVRCGCVLGVNVSTTLCVNVNASLSQRERLCVRVSMTVLVSIRIPACVCPPVCTRENERVARRGRL